MLLVAASKERSPWIVKPAASSRGRGIFLIMSVCNYGFAFYSVSSSSSLLSSCMSHAGAVFNMCLYVQWSSARRQAVN